MDKTKTTKIPESMDSKKPSRIQNNKKTKISEPMDSQNHREYQQKQKPRFQNQWVAKTIENT